MASRRVPSWPEVGMPSPIPSSSARLPRSPRSPGPRPDSSRPPSSNLPPGDPLSSPPPDPLRAAPAAVPLLPEAEPPAARREAPWAMAAIRASWRALAEFFGGGAGAGGAGAKAGALSPPPVSSPSRTSWYRVCETRMWVTPEALRRASKPPCSSSLAGLRVNPWRKARSSSRVTPRSKMKPPIPRSEMSRTSEVMWGFFGSCTCPSTKALGPEMTNWRRSCSASQRSSFAWATAADSWLRGCEAVYICSAFRATVRFWARGRKSVMAESPPWDPTIPAAAGRSGLR